MYNFFTYWKYINWIQSSPLMPAWLRTQFLILCGAKIHSSVRISSHVFIGSNRLSISKNVFINIGCFLDGNEEIVIEEAVRVGPYTKFLTASHTINPDIFRRAGISKNINLPVFVGRGSWIGIGATILPGVRIEEGCIIGAGALVIKSTKPNGLYAGLPARRIKDLPLAHKN